MGWRSDGEAEPLQQELGHVQAYHGEAAVQRQVLGAAPLPPSSPSSRAQRPVAPASNTATAALSTGLATKESDGAIVFRTPELDVESSAASTTAPPAPSVAAQPAAIAAPSPPAGTGVDMKQLDALAHAVYGRVSDRIKAELRLDRERAGRLIEHGVS